MDSKTMETLIRSFGNRNIEVSSFDTLEQARDEILRLIPANKTVGVGHSATLEAMNITKELLGRGFTVYDKSQAATKDESRVLKKKALLTDWYITGSNAISAEGHIVNIDHSGNRVAAMTFGPDKVIVIAGINKVTANLEDAIQRAKNEASPKNAKRAGFNPPCVKLGRCIDCNSAERVCNYISIIQGQPEKGRMRLFIVDQELGF